MFPGAHAETTPDAPAVILAGSGQVITYRELDAEANRVSHVFRSLGLQPGDHVALCLETHPRYFALVWGAHYAGLCYTAMSSRLTTDEMAYIIEDCGARAFVTSAYKADQAAELAPRLGGDVALYMMDGTVEGYSSWEEALAAQPATPLPEDRVEGRDMLYSSGTTGRPKGVELPLPDAPPRSTCWPPPCSGPPPTACTSRRPRCTTPPPCASAWRSSGPAPRSS